eukprot:3296584-Prymnesium_polylepis.1
MRARALSLSREAHAIAALKARRGPTRRSLPLAVCRSRCASPLPSVFWSSKHFWSRATAAIGPSIRTATIPRRIRPRMRATTRTTSARGREGAAATQRKTETPPRAPCTGTAHEGELVGGRRGAATAPRAAGGPSGHEPGAGCARLRGRRPTEHGGTACRTPSCDANRWRVRGGRRGGTRYLRSRGRSRSGCTARRADMRDEGGCGCQQVCGGRQGGVDARSQAAPCTSPWAWVISDSGMTRERGCVCACGQLDSTRLS